MKDMEEMLSFGSCTSGVSQEIRRFGDCTAIFISEWWRRGLGYVCWGKQQPLSVSQVVQVWRRETGMTWRSREEVQYCTKRHTGRWNRVESEEGGSRYVRRECQSEEVCQLNAYPGGWVSQLDGLGQSLEKQAVLVLTKNSILCNAVCQKFGVWFVQSVLPWKRGSVTRISCCLAQHWYGALLATTTDRLLYTYNTMTQLL